MNRSIFAGIAAALLMATLTACSEDDTARESDSDPSTETDTGDDTGDEDGAEVVPANELDAVGYALSSVLQNTDGYTVEGNTLVLTFSEGSVANLGEAHCITANSVATGNTVLLRYPDGEIDCTTVE
ncbi:hypothetical protein [Nocardioides stalactiti]|uniref:hypothetical protein n=1 Tax=Nocardioides stalactiti TaxID=2755356 RepID=UPI0016011992|nr:hypothetical protein [Nocardioides stalactiti]